MSRYFRTSLLITVSVLIFSCKNVQTEGPAETTLDSTLSLPTSVIVVPVSYTVSGLEDMLNEKIKGTVLKKWMLLDEKGDSLYLEISKTKPIHVSRENRTLYYNVPVSITGKYIAKIAGIKVRNATPVKADVVLKMASTFHMGRKWNLVSETDLLRIDWIEEPKIDLGLFKVNLRPVIEKVINEKESALTEKADEALMQLINTRKIVQKLWLDIQKPIVINKKKKMVWLQAQCMDITGKLLETDPDLISLQFELKTQARTFIEGDSIPPPNPKLPDFRHKEGENDSLIVYVHSTVKFDAVNELLNSELSGKRFEKKGLHVKIENVKVYGTATGIAVRIDVKGNIRGSLYAQGEPKFDSLSKVVAVRNLEFDLSTSNVLASSADWLLHSNILDLVKDKLEFNTETLAAKLPDLIMRGVEKGKTGQKININVGHLDVTPQQMLITKDNIQLLVKATGKANVELEKKLFEGKKKKKTV